MGQEASTPQDGVDPPGSADGYLHPADMDEFAQQQALAPPGRTHQSQRLPSSSQTQQRPLQSSLSPQRSSASSKISSMFQRGSSRSLGRSSVPENGYHPQQSQSQSQQHSPYRHAQHTSGSGHAPSPPQGQQQPHYPPPSNSTVPMTPEQQQYYYHQQQLQYQQHQQYQQQQQQQYQQQQQQPYPHHPSERQPYYAQPNQHSHVHPSSSGAQHHHAQAAGGPEDSLPSTSQQQQDYPVVGVMYASGGSRRHSRDAGSVSSGASPSRRGKSQQTIMQQQQSHNSGSRGGEIVGKMGALSLRQQQQHPSPGRGMTKTTGLSNDEDDWEARWDEDDEDSDGEEDDGPGEADTAGVVMSSTRVGPLQQQQSKKQPLVPLHRPFRPGMDGGHSSSSPIRMPVQMTDSNAFPQSQMGVQQTILYQQQSQPPEQHPQQHPIQSMQTVAEQMIMQPNRAEEEILTKQADLVLQQGENGIQWDTTSAKGPLAAESIERPHMQMFFPLLRVLGKGSFGKVVLVQKRTGKERGGLFAMKILRKAHLVKRRQIERTKTERKVLSVVDHPFIMKLHFAFQTEDKLYLVLDYCPGGELFFHLSRYRRFPERVARFYTAELILAMGHLHKRGIIYRDLKPENVLLDAEGHVKLGDFGLAKDKIKHPCEGATSMCGTPEYMAPEVLSQAGHGFCVDYWGLGMLVFEMMTGLPPWYTTDRAKLFRRLKSAPLEIPSYFSPHSASFVSSLLERNPRRRLGVAGIRTAMDHDFFRSIHWRALYARRVEAPIRPCEGWKPPEAGDNNGFHGSKKEGENNKGPNPGMMGNDGNNSMVPSAAVFGEDNRDSLHMEQITTDALDAATANFDNTFTRMAVDTDDGAHGGEYSGDEGGSEELHENTFVGFTFDEADDARKKGSSTTTTTRPNSSQANGSSSPSSMQPHR